MTTNPMRVPRQEPVQAQPQSVETPPLDSADLFKSRDEVVIRHAGDLYRLRRTRNGKLILTK